MVSDGCSAVELFIQVAHLNRPDTWIPGSEGGGCWCEAGCEPVAAAGEGFQFSFFGQASVFVLADLECW